ncbi:hypothetical protein LDENG_00266480 [Lucifuga dentata]|nr:hypothetical protein LDENG_00266480 [Lucifuga dentata]
MQDRPSWDAQGRSVGEISDQRMEEQLEDERAALQKRIFTRWMNVFLQRREPPDEVHNLFTDIQDGRILMALLEELTGCKLLYRFRSSSHRIFRLNNIAKALSFLDDRHVKLLGIDASGIADGVPYVVLNLIWNIILYFQVKELSGSLQRHLSSSLSSLSMSSFSSSDLSPLSSDFESYSYSTLPTKGRRAARKPKYHGKAIRTLLQWVQRCTSKFGVEVHDFGKSWRSGLAFLALIKSINPLLVDLRDSLSRQPRENIQEAFTVAQHSLGIPPLLEPEDVTCTSPDEQSIITYVSMFLRNYSDVDEDPKTRTQRRLCPKIPNFGSFESISFGETISDDPEAQTLFRRLGKSNEQLLWKRWSTRSLGEHRPFTHSMSRPINADLSNSNDIFSSYNPQSATDQTVSNAANSQFNKRRYPSVFQPTSPMDGSTSYEIQSWLEKSTADQSYNRPRMDFSLSSEEGTYNLTALDSDEEDAYSYILDLNKDVFQSHNSLNRQVPKVNEKTVEEMILNGQVTEELKHLKASEVLDSNRCEHEERSDAQNGDFGRKSEVKGQSVVRWNSDMGKNKIRLEKFNVFDLEEEPEDEGRSKEELEEKERVVSKSSNGDDDDGVEERKKEKTGNVRLVRCDRREVVANEAAETKEEHLLKLDNGKGKKGEEDDVKEEEGGTQESLVKFENFKVGKEKIITDKPAYEVSVPNAARINREKERDYRGSVAKTEDDIKEEEEEEDTNDSMSVVAVEDIITVEKEEEEEQKYVKPKPLTEKKPERAAHPTEATPENDAKTGDYLRDDDKNRSSTCGAASQSFSEGDAILQTLAASCDVTPLELELLLALWILLYCYFILPQMNL